jgi:Leucine-rich repeat (LRR) protein
LCYNKITEINWEGCPPGLTEINLGWNKITYMNWKGCPPGLTEINLRDNNITKMNWKGCPPELTKIDLCYNKITHMNWEGCRNDFITNFYDNKLEEYLEYKKSKDFIPYLPIVCKNKKEIYYELVHKLSTPPNGCLFLEDLEEMKSLGLFGKRV